MAYSVEEVLAYLQSPDYTDAQKTAAVQAAAKAGDMPTSAQFADATGLSIAEVEGAAKSLGLESKSISQEGGESNYWMVSPTAQPKSQGVSQTSGTPAPATENPLDVFKHDFKVDAGGTLTIDGKPLTEEQNAQASTPGTLPWAAVFSTNPKYAPLAASVKAELAATGQISAATADLIANTGYSGEGGKAFLMDFVKKAAMAGGIALGGASLVNAAGLGTTSAAATGIPNGAAISTGISDALSTSTLGSSLGTVAGSTTGVLAGEAAATAATSSQLMTAAVNGAIKNALMSAGVQLATTGKINVTSLAASIVGGAAGSAVGTAAAPFVSNPAFVSAIANGVASIGAQAIATGNVSPAAVIGSIIVGQGMNYAKSIMPESITNLFKSDGTVKAEADMTPAEKTSYASLTGTQVGTPQELLPGDPGYIPPGGTPAPGPGTGQYNIDPSTGLPYPMPVPDGTTSVTGGTYNINPTTGLPYSMPITTATGTPPPAQVVTGSATATKPVPDPNHPGYGRAQDGSLVRLDANGNAATQTGDQSPPTTTQTSTEVIGGTPAPIDSGSLVPPPTDIGTPPPAQLPPTYPPPAGDTGPGSDTDPPNDGSIVLPPPDNGTPPPAPGTTPPGTTSPGNTPPGNTPPGNTGATPPNLNTLLGAGFTLTQLLDYLKLLDTTDFAKSIMNKSQENLNKPYTPFDPTQFMDPAGPYSKYIDALTKPALDRNAEAAKALDIQQKSRAAMSGQDITAYGPLAGRPDIQHELTTRAWLDSNAKTVADATKPAFDTATAEHRNTYQYPLAAQQSSNTTLTALAPYSRPSLTKLLAGIATGANVKPEGGGPSLWETLGGLPAPTTPAATTAGVDPVTGLTPVPNSGTGTMPEAPAGGVVGSGFNPDTYAPDPAYDGAGY